MTESEGATQNLFLTGSQGAALIFANPVTGSEGAGLFSSSPVTGSEGAGPFSFVHVIGSEGADRGGPTSRQQCTSNTQHVHLH